jgi:purine-binding chemotaxis protein CheW
MGQTPGIACPVPPALPETPPVLRACLFDLAGSRFAVDVRNAREVAAFDEITAIPCAPRHLVGVANLRGTVLPIADIRVLLGLPAPRPARSARTLVLRDGALVVAAVVDTVLGLETFDEIVPPGSPLAARARGPRQFVAGWIAWAGETLPLLDVPRLLAALRPTTRAGEPAQGGPV